MQKEKIDNKILEMQKEKPDKNKMMQIIFKSG
jgi:hypothetical protein